VITPVLVVDALSLLQISETKELKTPARNNKKEVFLWNTGKMKMKPSIFYLKLFEECKRSPMSSRG